MGAPHGAELVVPGQGAVGVVGNVGDGKIVGHEGVGQATKGEQQESELAPGGRLRQAHPQAIAAPGTQQGHHGLDHRKAQREDHRQLAQLRNKQCGRHGLALLGWGGGRGLAAVFQGFGDLGRHVFFIVLGQHFVSHYHAVGVELAQGDNALAFAETGPGECRDR